MFFFLLSVKDYSDSHAACACKTTSFFLGPVPLSPACNPFCLPLRAVAQTYFIRDGEASRTGPAAGVSAFIGNCDL